MIQVLNKMDQDGSLQKLFKAGLISWKAMLYRDLYLQYDIYIKKGFDPINARAFTAEDFKVCDKTVERAVKK